MLEIIVPEIEAFDEIENKFIKIKETKLTLEHSLVSLHKWEQKWKKPFLKEGTLKETGTEGILDYIRCMTINKPVDSRIYLFIPENEIQKIVEYINDPMTATWFKEDKETPKRNGKPIRKPHKEIQTAETIYWQMIALNIPKEFEKWHLNSLLTLIRVCGIKNEEQYNKSDTSKKKKPNLKSRAALNAQRRAAAHSRG